jgi:ribonuclease P protein component
LPRTAILRKPDDFKKVFRNPVVSADACFKVLARVNSEQHSRLGMAVSRQIDKRAVGRNRIKRVVRESFRSWTSRQSSEQRLDIVVLPRREAATICNMALFNSLSRHWSKLEELAR